MYKCKNNKNKNENNNINKNTIENNDKKTPTV